MIKRIHSYLLRFILLLTPVIPLYGQTEIEEGIATYYHKRFDGRRTSNGGVYKRTGFTAAHRTYPFGTYLRVTNIRNQKSIIVEVTDRGPRNRNRLIDVSYAAAKELDFIRQGLTRVKLEVVPFAFEPRYLEVLKPIFPYSIPTKAPFTYPLRFKD